MSSTIARWAHHTDAEHAARENGFNAGWSHANYTEAYGEDRHYAGPEVPDRFRHEEDVWLEAFQEGEDAFVCDVEDGEIVDLYRVDHEWTDGWGGEDNSPDLGC